MSDSDENNRSVQQAIEAQAIDLLAMHRRSPTAKTAAAVEEFRKQSPKHDVALRSADRFLNLSRGLQSDSPGLLQSIWYQSELCLARLAGRPYALASVLLIALAMTGTWYAMNQSRIESSVASLAVSERAPANLYRTIGKQQRKIDLADGSAVWLGWNTEIAVSLAPEERLVTLRRGIAAFQVQSASDRPFLVDANGVRTRVTGTEFIVDLQQRKRVEVAVLEGRVEVEVENDQTAVLVASESVTVTDGSVNDVVTRTAEELGSWREGMLVFSNRPLLDALRTLEPYTSFAIDMRQISKHPGLVSGVFFIDQADDALFTILESHYLTYSGPTRNVLELR
ncbi:MAG: FecR domain-containing protein [Pseudomonadota bacterium]